MTISIIIPTLNEERNLPIALKEIKNFFSLRKEMNYEILIVDGYSDDKTLEIAKRYDCGILFDKFGKGSAIRTGLKEAKGDIMITMDADVSHRAKEIALLVAGIKTGYDIVMGSRFIQGGGTQDMPFYRKLGNKFFVSLVNLFWGMHYSDLCYGYRGFSRKAGGKMLSYLESNGFGIETEIAILSAKLGLNVLEVPSFEKKRKYGEGKLKTFEDGFNILTIIIRSLFCKKR